MVENDNSIFQSFDPKDNDIFSRLNRDEMIEFLYQIDDYLLEYRNSLNLGSNVSFGMEIEYSDAVNARIDSKLSAFSPDGKWQTKPERAFPNAKEIATPILYDKPSDWKKLQRVCRIVKDGFNRMSLIHSGHIHVGANILGENIDNWLRFMKIWAAYEDVIFRFCYGEYLTERNSLKTYAPPVSLMFWWCQDNFKDDDDISRIIGKIGKTNAVNFAHVSLPISNAVSEGNTIEFRCPNGTLNPTVWQNNVNFLVKMLKYAKSSKYDSDLIDYRYDCMFNQLNDLREYRGIRLPNALELADMVFDNNLDKIYFLRQYLKSLDVGDTPMEKAKKFTL